VTSRFLIPALLLLLLSCARLPAITPKDGPSSSGIDKPHEARRIFPDGSWQFLHSIRAELPGGRNFGMMGLTVMSSRLQTRRSVIMTLEGFVIFDGEYDRRVIVHRALPPFDSPHFAGGLMEDIRLVFFEPDGPVVDFGELGNGSVVRRHQITDGSTVDVEALPDGDWQIRRYSPSHELIRTVRARHGAGNPSGFPETIELTASGDQAYRLIMTLVEAVSIEP
jgi:hypothetical protein